MPERKSNGTVSPNRRSQPVNKHDQKRDEDERQHTRTSSNPGRYISTLAVFRMMSRIDECSECFYDVMFSRAYVITLLMSSNNAFTIFERYKVS